MRGRRTLPAMATKKTTAKATAPAPRERGSRGPAPKAQRYRGVMVYLGPKGEEAIRAEMRRVEAEELRKRKATDGESVADFLRARHLDTLSRFIRRRALEPAGLPFDPDESAPTVP